MCKHKYSETSRKMNVFNKMYELYKQAHDINNQDTRFFIYRSVKNGNSISIPLEEYESIMSYLQETKQ